MNELTKYGVYMQLNIKELKRKEVLMHDTTWMNLKNIMLNERSQIQKAIYLQFHLYKVFRIGKPIETESSLMVDRSWRGTGN